MATVIDPVCGMRIEADDAAAIAEHDGQIYYFCTSRRASALAPLYGGSAVAR